MNSDQKQELQIYIRWMIRRDYPEVLSIENESFEFPWLEEDFIFWLRQRNCIGLVAEYNNTVIGFTIYELTKRRTHILNLAVSPKYLRQKVGSKLIAKLKAKLSLQQRERITVEIRESNLPAQQFFRACGFKAISILRDYYEDTPEDAYVMQYRLRAKKEIRNPFHLTNRIVGLDNSSQ